MEQNAVLIRRNKEGKVWSIGYLLEIVEMTVLCREGFWATKKQHVKDLGRGNKKKKVTEGKVGKRPRMNFPYFMVLLRASVPEYHQKGTVPFCFLKGPSTHTGKDKKKVCKFECNSLSSLKGIGRALTYSWKDSCLCSCLFVFRRPKAGIAGSWMVELESQAQKPSNLEVPKLIWLTTPFSRKKKLLSDPLEIYFL